MGVIQNPLANPSFTLLNYHSSNSHLFYVNVIFRKSIKEENVMSEMVVVTEENKKTFINALNLSLEKQEHYHKDFIITDVSHADGGAEIITESCKEIQLSDRPSLLQQVFKDCRIEMRILSII
jgi:hypothetical protein